MTLFYCRILKGFAYVPYASNIARHVPGPIPFWINDKSTSSRWILLCRFARACHLFPLFRSRQPPRRYSNASFLLTFSSMGILGASHTFPRAAADSARRLDNNSACIRLMHLRSRTDALARPPILWPIFPRHRATPPPTPPNLFFPRLFPPLPYSRQPQISRRRR